MSRLDRFFGWLAFRLPRKLVYWCAIRLHAWGTSGAAFGNTHPASLGFIAALDRWALCHHCAAPLGRAHFCGEVISAGGSR